jgi:hypothetical protein
MIRNLFTAITNKVLSIPRCPAPTRKSQRKTKFKAAFTGYQANVNT